MRIFETGEYALVITFYFYVITFYVITVYLTQGVIPFDGPIILQKLAIYLTLYFFSHAIRETQL